MAYVFLKRLFAVVAEMMMPIDPRQETFTLGVVEAIRRLFPGLGKQEQIMLFRQVLPTLSDYEFRYWLDWHGLTPHHQFFSSLVRDRF
jgi:hypothetical protein